MANSSNITFAQEIVESVWSSLNEGEVEENAYDFHRALDVLIAQGKNFHKRDMSGSMLEANVSGKKMGLSQNLVRGQEYDLQNVEPLAGAKWDWALTATPLVFNLEEVAENQGKQKIVDTVQYKINEAKTDHMDKLNYNFFRGTGTLPSSESLNTIIGTSDWGGLSVTNYDKWIGHVDATSQNLALTVVDKAIDACMFAGSQGIDFLISGLTLFQRWKALGANTATIYQPADQKKPYAANQGIEYITFRDAVWYWDRQCQDVADPLGYGDTANYLYGVNSGKIMFACVKGFYQTVLPRREPVNQLAWNIPIVSMYQFAATNRRSNFKLTNMGTS